MTDAEHPNGHLATERLAALIAKYLEGAYLAITSPDLPLVTAATASGDIIALTVESLPETGTERRVEHRELRLSLVQIPDEHDAEPEAEEVAA